MPKITYLLMPLLKSADMPEHSMISRACTTNTIPKSSSLYRKKNQNQQDAKQLPTQCAVKILFFNCQ